MQIINAGLTATIGTNAGTVTETSTPSVSVVGDNTKGKIIINTGYNPGGQNICRLNFTQNYGSDSINVAIVAANRQAKEVNCVAEACENSGFELNSTDQLDTNMVYEFFYEVFEIVSPLVN